jgi:hypothetical protein
MIRLDAAAPVFVVDNIIIAAIVVIAVTTYHLGKRRFTLKARVNHGCGLRVHGKR